MTKEEFKVFAESDEGKLLLQPLVDSRVTQGITTYKQNHLMPEEAMKRLKILEAADAKKDVINKKQALDIALFKKCTSADIPYELLQDIPFESEEAQDEKIALFKGAMGDKATEKINEKMAKNAFQPGSGTASKLKPNLTNMSPEELQLREEVGTLDTLIDDVANDVN